MPERFRLGETLPSDLGAGVYMIVSGDCTSHIGSSGGLRGRISSLKSLGTHRGSAEVLCGAFCTGRYPEVVIVNKQLRDAKTARERESRLKASLGEPPIPTPKYAGCKNGRALRDALVKEADKNTWEAGYIEATFDIGEKLALLLRPRFAQAWRRVGIPPGPWEQIAKRNGLV